MTTFFARLKAALRAGIVPPPPISATPMPVSVDYGNRTRPVVYSAGVGVDWDHFENTRRLRLCACGQRHRRCDECAGWVCANKPHACSPGGGH